jgi:hypothetical protein
MEFEWLDDDGYPTDEALDRIEKWGHEDTKGCFDFVRSLWHWENSVWIEHRPNLFNDKKTDHIMCFSTGGWSGNESLVAAMKNNMWCCMRWLLSKRGGYYEYEYDAT